MYEARRKLFPKVLKFLVKEKACCKSKTNTFLKGGQICFMVFVDSIPMSTSYLYD